MSEPRAVAPRGSGVPHSMGRAHRPHERVWRGVQRGPNWLQLVKFGTVGASGYVVNLVAFTVSLQVLDNQHIGAATIAFFLALANNFWWNRRWTFDAERGQAHRQALRFLTVSIFAFAFAALLLDLILRFTSFLPILAQASAIAAATPLNFVGNKMWTFRVDPPTPSRG